MSTISLPLPGMAWRSTSDVANWASAQAQVKQSSGVVPSPRWIEWLFDDSTDEFIVTSFIVPDNFVSSPVLKVHWKSAADTSGTIGFEVQVSAVGDGDAEDVDAHAFDTAAMNAGTGACPIVAGYLDVISITLTNNDSMAAGDFVTLALNRNVSADTSAVVSADVELIGADFQYST